MTVHSKQELPFLTTSYVSRFILSANSSGIYAAEETERAGYLPGRTAEERMETLSTPSGSITYIGATMRASADVLAKSGYNINNQPMLTNLYHGRTLEKLINHFANKRYPPQMSKGDDEMGNWVKNNLLLLHDAVRKQFTNGTPLHRDMCKEQQGLLFQNVGNSIHTLTSGAPGSSNSGELFDTGVVSPGGVVPISVMPSGPVYCTLHPYEQGQSAFRNFQMLTPLAAEKLGVS
jgi:hypothetical protein